MPLLNITTNASLDDIDRSELLRALSALVARLLGKPERYVMINLKHNADMLFAGNGESLAYLELKSIGLPQGRTAAFSSELTEAVSGHLGVQADRVYIEFADAERHLWGWNGGTFV